MSRDLDKVDAESFARESPAAILRWVNSEPCLDGYPTDTIRATTHNKVPTP